MKKDKPAVELSHNEIKMLNDDNFFDVSPREVFAFIRKLNTLKYPRDTIVKMRIKYDAWLCDKEKEIMDRFGLDYSIHCIEPHPAKVKLSDTVSASQIYINGYTPAQWQILTDDSYVPSNSLLMRMLNLCKKFGDDEALQILKVKYAEQIEEANAYLAKTHKLPEGIEFDDESSGLIDGLSPFAWRLLHDDDFEKPRKGFLLSTLKQMRAAGRIEEANAIEEKYFTYLHPASAEKELYAEIWKAEEYLMEMFPDSDSLKQKIAKDRKRRGVGTDGC